MDEKSASYRVILRQKEYMKLILASLINRFGDAIDAVASTWIVYELTGNAAWSAVIFGINRIPTVVITPLAGAWVEGRKKKSVMVITDLIRAFCVAFVATGYLFGFLQAWMLVLTTFAISAAEAFRGPANTALIPKVLKKEYLEYGMSLSSTLGSIVELIGTAMAAGIIALIGTSGAIYVDMVTFLLSAFIISAAKIAETDSGKMKFDQREYFQTLKSGFSYVKASRVLRFLMVYCVFLNAILVPINSLQAPLASEVLNGGAEVLSVIGIGVTIGMILGAFTFPMVQKVLGGRAMLALTALGMALFHILLIVLQPFYTNPAVMYTVTAVLTAILGYTVAIGSAYDSIKTMKFVEEDYLARVSSISSAMGSAAMPVTSFLLSIIVAKMNTGAIFIIAGVCAVIAMVWIMFSSAISELDKEKTGEEVSA